MLGTQINRITIKLVFDSVCVLVSSFIDHVIIVACAAHFVLQLGLPTLVELASGKLRNIFIVSTCQFL